MGTEIQTERDGERSKMQPFQLQALALRNSFSATKFNVGNVCLQLFGSVLPLKPKQMHLV